MAETAVFLTTAHVPLEIISFFGKSTTSSLLVKGIAGTGKTTFALEMLNVMSKFENVYYVSTRVSNEALYRHYPWLKQKELSSPKRQLQPGMPGTMPEQEKEMEFLTAGDYFGKEKFMYAGIRRLEEERREPSAPAPKGPSSGPTLNLDTPFLDRLGRREAMPDIEAIYHKVNENIPNKSFFVLDSLKGLVGKYHLEPEDLVFTLQKDLVERNYADLLIIMEDQGPTSLDFLSDGVVEMRPYHDGGRRYRTIFLQKLRGEEIRQPEYLMTLHEGRFRSFRPFGQLPPAGQVRMTPIQAGPGYFSTGSADIDEILGGGYPLGSNVIIEIGGGVPNDALRLLTATTAINFLVQGGGVMLVPFSSTSKNDISAIASSMGLEAEFRNHFLAIDQARGGISDDLNTLYLDFKSFDDDLQKYERAKESLHERTNKGVAELVGTETLVARYGEDMYERELTMSAEKTRREGGLAIRVTTSPASSLTQTISAISEIHIGLVEQSGAILFYGVKPKTQYFHLSWRSAEGRLTPVLVPIV